MISKLLFNLILLTFNPGDLNHFLDHCVDHFTENGRQEIRSEMPQKLKNELSILLETQLGKAVHETCMTERMKLRLIKVPAEDAYWSDNNLGIYYSTNVEKWYQLKSQDMDIPKGANLDVVTLGALIAHEIGHTTLGRKALKLPFIEKGNNTSGQSTSGEIVISLNRESLKREEIRATQYFENAYREYIGLPLRHSYFEENDVRNP